MALDPDICDSCWLTYNGVEEAGTLIVGSSRTSPFHSGEHCSGTGTTNLRSLSSSSSRTIILKAAKTKTTDKKNIEISSHGHWVGGSLRVSIAGIGEACDFNVTPELEPATAAQSLAHSKLLND